MLGRKILDQSKPKEKMPKQETVTQHPAVPDIKLGVEDNKQSKRKVYKY